jgi:hypothetical protein
MKTAYDFFTKTSDEIKNSGLWKTERIITTPQSPVISTTEKNGLINM